MKLETQNFKDFFAYTKNMKPNNILPIYGYVKLSVSDGIGTLEKTNGTSYCKYTFEHDGSIEVLLDDAEIKTFISNTKDTFFTISVDDVVTLSNSVMDGFSFPTVPVIDYPVQPEITEGKTKLNPLPFYIASKFVDPNHMGWMQCVVSDENGILGTDNYRIFYSAGNYPTMVLSQECCNTISQLTDVYHTASENHDFFIADGVTYGFNKPAFGVPAFMSVVNKIDTGGFKVKRSDLLLFCDTTTPRSDKPCSMDNNGVNSMILSLHDKDKNKKNNMVIEIDGECSSFVFHAKKMADLLRPLPYETLRFNIGKNLSITTDEDANYKGTLTQLIIQ